ncbi:acetyltransferase [uncultured Treponema sp.]|uniref:acetyltransferase n=1 Tax=uncultured Treponema sp. TaxID=162155 RepID=UPI00259329A3|nr:acetyltransferase [uncultured Treponema sp.]
MNKPIIIIGAGDHAKVLLDILLEQDVTVIGLTDKNISKGNCIYGVSVIGDDSEILKYKTDEIELVNGIGSVGNTSIRQKVFSSLKEKGYFFRSVIHEASIVSKRAKLGEGVQLLAGAIVNIEAEIDDNTIINTKTSIDHGCVIGKHCHIAPGCSFSGCVRIGDCTHIGTGTSIIQGINIGKNVLIGAGSVVINDVSDNEKAFGVPARVRK